ncbi:MAG: P-loop NTPase fold protein [Rikenellaceae bacterium]
MRTTPIEIDAENPFANCKLNRERYADVLTSIVESYKDGFVLAINGKWGTGKTTFMNMWRQSLENKEYRTIYFNAWENDFTSEPMVAILGELKSLTATENSLFDNILEKSAKFSSAILPILAKTAATLAGFGGVADAIEKTSEAALCLINNEIEEYDKKKEALSEIKKDLAEFIKENCGDKPLVFIVDELDRCRPDYAVEVLEKIKHLFAVEGVVFVLSIDKEQLGHAVCGYYGSAKIDSREYLRRFVDLEYTIPEPDYNLYTNHLCETSGVDSIKSAISDTSQREYIVSIIGHYCKNGRFSLRQIDKIFALAKITMRSSPMTSLKFEIAVLLIIIKEFHSKLYGELKNSENNVQNIANLFDEEFKDYYKDQEALDVNPLYFYGITVRILIMFNNNNRVVDNVIKADGSLAFKYLSFENIKDQLQSYGIDNHFQYNEKSKLSYYINAIDLLSTLKV